MQLTDRQTRLVGLGLVLVAPIVGIVALRAPLFNNLVYRDPWFYSGYGWTLAHHIENFGWFYYAVRFPVTLPIGWTTDLFGPVTGYLVLRYAILTGTGAVLYMCVRRFASVWVAAAAVLALALNPFYLRMVLWDYTSYVAVPAALAGVALWLMASASGKGRFWPYFAAGALFSASAFANALSVSVVVPLVVVELVGAIRRGPWELGRLFIRAGIGTAGAIALFAAGYLGYVAYIGSFSPLEIVQPTIDFVRSNDQLAAPLQRPVSEFLDGEPRIYAPVLLCAALVLVLGRRVLEDSLPGRLAQYAIGYVGLLWLYRFAVTSSVVETWWSYNMAAVSMAFAVPVILHQLERQGSVRDIRAIVAGVIGGAAIVSIVVRNANDDAVRVYERIRDSAPLVLLLLIGGLAAAALMRSKVSSVRIASATALFVLVAFVALTPARYIGINQTGEFAPDGRGEILGYQAAYDMSKLLEGDDQPDSRILLWTTLSGLPMVAWTDLPHQFSSIQSPEAPTQSLNQLTPLAEDLVRHPTTDSLLLLSENPADMTRGVDALARSGIQSTVRREGTWADGHLYYRLIDVEPAR